MVPVTPLVQVALPFTLELLAGHVHPAGSKPGNRIKCNYEGQAQSRLLKELLVLAILAL